jgi:hypothetical protein
MIESDVGTIGELRSAQMLQGFLRRKKPDEKNVQLSHNRKAKQNLNEVNLREQETHNFIERKRFLDLG